MKTLLLLSLLTQVWPEAGVRLHPPAPVAKPAKALRVYLDAGHGAPGNTGTRSCLCEDEQTHTLRLGEAVKRQLVERGFEVKLSRTGSDRPSYPNRLRDAQAFRADVIISLHFDARGTALLWKVGEQWCYRNDSTPGFSVLWSDEGSQALTARRKALAVWIAKTLQQTGFLPYDGIDYPGLYDSTPEAPGAFVDRHEPSQRIFFLRRPSIPSVIVETHHALDWRETQRFGEEATVKAFGESLAAALLRYSESTGL